MEKCKHCKGLGYHSFINQDEPDYDTICKKCNGLGIIMKVKLKDPELTLLAAMRYAIGRNTYIVSHVISDIKNNWDCFSDERKEAIKAEIIDCHNYFNNQNYGDWQQILDLS